MLNLHRRKNGWRRLNAANCGRFATIPLTELTQRSDAIAHVRVVDRSYPVPKAGETALRTLVSVQVLKTYKGSIGEKIEISVPGGIQGERISVVPGAPDFKREAEAVVFL